MTLSTPGLVLVIFLYYQSGLFGNSFRLGYVGDVLKYPRDQHSSNREHFTEEIDSKTTILKAVIVQSKLNILGNY